MNARMMIAVGLIVALAGCGDDDGGGGGADSGGGAMDSGGGGTDSGGGGTDSGGGGTDSGGGGTDSGGGGTDSGGGGTDSGMAMCVMTGGSCAGEGALCCAGLDCCSGVPIPPGMERCAAAGMCPESDRNIKHGFASVDPEAILARVASLPISTWSYDDEPSVRHMGPMAQDFAEAFEVGADDRHIHVIDMNGVSTAAIQALHARTEALSAENAELRRDNDALRAAVARIEARLGPE